MNEKVIALLKKQLWTLGTYGTEPNAVPVAFKDVTADGKLLVGDVFLDATLQNIRRNGSLTQGLPCENDRLNGGLECRPPAFPLRSFFRNSFPLISSKIFCSLSNLSDCTFNNISSFSPPMPRRFINRLADIMRFWETTAVDPHQRIPDFKASVLNGAH